MTHSISDYYGLDSKSVLIQGQGSKGKKVIFVGVKKQQQRKVAVKEQHLPVLPPPLWEMF